MVELDDYKKYLDENKLIIETALKNSTPANIKNKNNNKIAKNNPQVVNKNQRRFFLDVGCWQGDHEGVAKTDFGIVCENFVVRCTWLNMEGLEDLKKKKEMENLKFPQKIIDFFGDNQNAGVVDFFYDPIPFTNPNEILLFLPDLHLHLYKWSKADNFKYKNKNENIVPLDNQLTKLLKSAQKVGANVIQVGDCFEVWEAQAHLIEDYEKIKEAVEKNKVLIGEQTVNNLTRWHIWKELVNQRRIFPRWDLEYEVNSIEHLAREAKACYMKIEKFYNLDSIKKYGIKIDDNRKGDDSGNRSIDDIISGIKNKHKLIFDNKELEYKNNLPFTWLRGNHDNMRSNRFYIPKHFITNSAFHEKTLKGGDVINAYDIYRGGINECIWAEHGHRFDDKNADNIYDGNRKGFFWTRLYTLGNLLGKLGETGTDEGKIIQKGMEFWEYIDYYMRRDQLNLAYDIFNKESKVRIVIMGHTHQAILIEWEHFLRDLKRLYDQKTEDHFNSKAHFKL